MAAGKGLNPRLATAKPGPCHFSTAPNQRPNILPMDLINLDEELRLLRSITPWVLGVGESGCAGAGAGSGSESGRVSML